MYILDRVKLDKQRRINITKFFDKPIPKTVGIAYDPDTKEIIIEPYSTNHNFILRKVDCKNRITLPSWMTALTQNNLFLTVVDGNRKLKIIDSF